MKIEIVVTRRAVFVLMKEAGIESSHIDLERALYFIESARDRKKTPEQINNMMHVSFALDVNAKKVVIDTELDLVDVIWLNSFESEMITRFDRRTNNICYQGVNKQ